MPISERTKGTANFLQVYFVGVCMVMAGHCAFWPAGFIQGFWEYFISTIIISIAFLCLCLCLAEMISILPFGGGAYGFSRVTMGPFLGFMVGFFDSISNIIYVSLFVRTFVILFNFCFFIEYNLTDEPYMWFIMYVGIICLQILFGKFSFSFFSFMGFIVLAIPVMFLLGTAHRADFHEWVTLQERLYGHELFPLGSKGFFQLLPVSGLLFFGIDMLCLVCEDTKNAARMVPKAMMAVYVTIFVLAIALMFSVPSQYPGVVISAYNPLPLTFGFADIFKLKLQTATISVLPSEFMEVYGLTYAFGRQMCALSRSSLLPHWFSWTTTSNVPYMSLIVGSVLGMLNLVVLNYSYPPQFAVRISEMYYVAQLCSITVYVISMLSFIVFRYKYGVLERHFHVGILGIPMALIGMSIFLMIFVMLAFFEYDDRFIIKAYCILFGFGATYYIAYARKHQSFSQEEQSILFAVYVIKANSRHRTVYRWIEKRFKKHVWSHFSNTSISNIRTSWRKSIRTKSKVTPLENTNDDKKAQIRSDSHVKPSGAMSNESDLFKSSNMSMGDIKSENLEGEVQLFERVGIAPVSQIELQTAAINNFEPPTSKLDVELDQLIQSQIRFKMQSSTKSDNKLSDRILVPEVYTKSDRMNDPESIHLRKNSPK